MAACMCQFLVHFYGQFGTPLQEQDIQEWKNIIIFKSIASLMVGLWWLWCWRNCSNFAGPRGQATIVSLTYLNHLAGFQSVVSSAIFSKWSINILLTTGGWESLISILSFWGVGGEVELRLKLEACSCQMSSSTIKSSVCIGEHSGMDQCWVYFLQSVVILPLVHSRTIWHQNSPDSLHFKGWCPVSILWNFLNTLHRTLYCLLEGSGFYGENWLEHNRETYWSSLLV